MGRSFSSFGAAPWGRPATPSGANPRAIGVSIGSGYQLYFAALSASAQTAEIARMQDAGISWVRMDAPWNSILQPTATSDFGTIGGTYGWGDPRYAWVTQTALALRAAGIDVLLILLEAPAWSLAVGNNPAVPGNPYPTVSPTAYAAFCGSAAATFGPRGVSAFELWNEPNLDAFNPDFTPGVSVVSDALRPSSSSLGLGCYGPEGYAYLAGQAYQAIHGQYAAGTGGSPKPTVLGGAMAGWPRLDWNSTTRSGASWSAVAAGATSATITCADPAVSAGDDYHLLTGASVSTAAVGAQTTSGEWPSGTYISSVTSTGYVVSPPPWLGSFPVPVNAASGATIGVGSGFPPDVYLAGMYQYTNSLATPAPICDALSMHPYAFPNATSFTYADSGSWALVPTIRALMKSNGDGAKPIWFTELGCPSGQSQGTWTSAQGTAASSAMTIDSPSALATDVGYLVGLPGLPLGSYVASADPGVSWTILPPTGLTVSSSVTTTSGTTLSQLTVDMAASVLLPPTTQGGSATLASAPSITLTPPLNLTVWTGNGNGYSAYASQAGVGVAATTFHSNAQPPLNVTVTEVDGKTGPVTVTAGQAGIVLTLAASITVPGNANNPISLAGGAIQCANSLGQTLPTAVPAPAYNTAPVVNVVAPGVLAPASISPPPTAPSANPAAICSEAQQAAVIPYAFQWVANTPWPYIGPMFVYCWSDASAQNNAGPFGLTRVDGSAKPALAALTAVSGPGALRPPPTPV